MRWPQENGCKECLGVVTPYNKLHQRLAFKKLKLKQGLIRRAIEDHSQ